MQMIELNKAQSDILNEMANSNPSQVILRHKETDPEPRRTLFKTLNENIDELLAHGFIEMPPNQPPKPPGFPYEFRIVNITPLGLIIAGKGPSAGTV